MRTFYKKYGLLIWLFLIFVTGSSALVLQSEFLPPAAGERANLEQLLQVTSEQVLAEVQKEILQITADPAPLEQTPAMREWLLNPEQETAPIASELLEIQKKITGKPVQQIALIATERAQSLNAHGVLQTLSQQNPADAWFFKSIKNTSSIQQIIDVDRRNRDILRITSSQHLLDENGKLIGVIAINTQSDHLKRQLEALQNKYHRLLYLADDQGNLLFANDSTKHLRDKLLTIAGVQQVAASLLASKRTDIQFTEFKEANASTLLASRYLPELGLHLFLEHPLSSETTTPAPSQLINLVICVVMAILVLLLAFLRLWQLQRRLDQSAATDQLTSLLNRQAFDFVFHQAMADSERSRQPLCVALIDIDLFKQVNKKNGHLLGDHILKEIAMIAKRSLRDSDVICRWGGEEFLILLKNCTLEKATSIAETLRQTIANNDFSRTTDLTKKRVSITVSMGVAECKINEKDDSVFERAEIALKQAKENGRNGVYFAE